MRCLVATRVTSGSSEANRLEHCWAPRRRCAGTKPSSRLDVPDHSREESRHVFWILVFKEGQPCCTIDLGTRAAMRHASPHMATPIALAVAGGAFRSRRKSDRFQLHISTQSCATNRVVDQIDLMPILANHVAKIRECKADLSRESIFRILRKISDQSLVLCIEPRIVMTLSGGDQSFNAWRCV
jgi:hypothetical protein